MVNSNQDYGRRRYLFAGWAILETMLFGGIVNGWASLVFVLKEEGLYADLCEHSGATNESAGAGNASGDAWNATTEAGNETSYWDLLNTTTTSYLANTGSTACPAQDAMLNLWFTVAAALRNMFGIFVGLHVFKFGTRSARLTGWLSFVVGALMMAFANNSIPWLVLPSLLTLSYGGVTLLLTNVQISCLFPRAAGVVITLVSGAFDFSATTQLLVKILHEAGLVSRLWSYVGLSGMQALMVIFSTLLFMPKDMFFSKPPPEKANYNKTSASSTKNSVEKQSSLSAAAARAARHSTHTGEASSKQLPDPRRRRNSLYDMSEISVHKLSHSGFRCLSISEGASSSSFSSEEEQQQQDQPRQVISVARTNTSEIGTSAESSTSAEIDTSGTSSGNTTESGTPTYSRPKTPEIAEVKQKEDQSEHSTTTSRNDDDGDVAVTRTGYRNKEEVDTNNNQTENFDVEDTCDLHAVNKTFFHLGDLELVNDLAPSNEEKILSPPGELHYQPTPANMTNGAANKASLPKENHVDSHSLLAGGHVNGSLTSPRISQTLAASNDEASTLRRLHFAPARRIVTMDPQHFHGSTGLLHQAPIVTALKPFYHSQGLDATKFMHGEILGRNDGGLGTLRGVVNHGFESDDVDTSHSSRTYDPVATISQVIERQESCGIRTLNVGGKFVSIIRIHPPHDFHVLSYHSSSLSKKQGEGVLKSEANLHPQRTNDNLSSENEPHPPFTTPNSSQNEPSQNGSNLITASHSNQNQPSENRHEVASTTPNSSQNQPQINEHRVASFDEQNSKWWEAEENSQGMKTEQQGIVHLKRNGRAPARSASVDKWRKRTISHSTGQDDGSGKQETEGDEADQTDVVTADEDQLFLTLKSCLTSAVFWLHVLWMSCNVLRLVAVFGLINTKLTTIFQGDKDRVSFFTNVQAYFMLSIMGVCWVSGAVYDWQTSAYKGRRSEFQRRVLPGVIPLAATSIVGVAISILWMIDSEPVLYFMFACLVFYNSFIFGVNISFLLRVFPERYFGLLNGVESIVSGVFCFLQYGLFRWYEEAPLQAEIFMLILAIVSLVHPIYIIVKGVVLTGHRV